MLFLNHVSVISAEKPITNPTTTHLKTKFVILVKKGIIFGSRFVNFSTSVTPSSCVATAACPENLLKASVSVITDWNVLTTLLPVVVSNQLNLTVHPSSHQVKSLGFCITNIIVKGRKHPSTRVYFWFSKSATTHNPLYRWKFETCAMAAAETNKIGLFLNLTSGVKSESWRFPQPRRSVVQAKPSPESFQ